MENAYDQAMKFCTDVAFHKQKKLGIIQFVVNILFLVDNNK